MRKFIIIFCVFNFNLAFAQTYSSLISDKEIYDFLNWMTVNDEKFDEEPKLKLKQIHYRILKWDRANFILKDSALVNQFFDEDYIYNRESGADTIFNQLDRDFIYKQFTSIKDTIWHERFINSKLLTKKKQKNSNRYYYSIPLFSIDKKYVIIKRIYYCGSSCAYGGFFVYRRLNNNGWEYVTEVNSWIS